MDHPLYQKTIESAQTWFGVMIMMIGVFLFWWMHYNPIFFTEFGQYGFKQLIETNKFWAFIVLTGVILGGVYLVLCTIKRSKLILFLNKNGERVQGRFKRVEYYPVAILLLPFPMVLFCTVHYEFDVDGSTILGRSAYMWILSSALEDIKKRSFTVLYDPTDCKRNVWNME